MKYRLEYLSGPFKGKRLVLEASRQAFMGPSADCEIQLEEDAAAERVKVAFELRDGNVHLHVEEGHDPVKVNQQEVEDARLAHGDRILAGSTELLFQEIWDFKVPKGRRHGPVQLVAALLIGGMVLGQLAFLTYQYFWSEGQIKEVALQLKERDGDQPAGEKKQPPPPPPESEEEEGSADVGSLMDLAAGKSSSKTAPDKTPVEDKASSAAPVEVPENARPATIEPSENALPAQPADIAVPDPDEVAEIEPAPAEVELADAEEGAEPGADAEGASATGSVAAVDRDHSEAERSLNRALKFIRQNELDKAEALLAQIAEDDPDFEPARVERAYLYEKRGDKAGAITAWSRIMKETTNRSLYYKAYKERRRVSQLVNEENKAKLAQEKELRLKEEQEQKLAEARKKEEAKQLAEKKRLEEEEAARLAAEKKKKEQEASRLAADKKKREEEQAALAAAEAAKKEADGLAKQEEEARRKEELARKKAAEEAARKLREEEKAQKLRELEEAALLNRPTPPTPDVPSAAPIKESSLSGGLVRIESVDREKFQGTAEYDEMRLFRIKLERNPGRMKIASGDVKVVIAFFDRGKDSGDIYPSRVLVPEEPLSVFEDWGDATRKQVSAAYFVPREFRKDEKREHGEAGAFYGYVVQTYFRGKLQDESARPENLKAYFSAYEAQFPKP